MIKAQFDSIIVEPINMKDRKAGNIIIPDTGKEKALYGIVVSVGQGKYSIGGQLIPPTIKVGQKVMLPLMGPIKLEYNRKEYYGCSETMVLAVVED